MTKASSDLRQSISNGYRGSFPGGKCGRGVTLTTHPHLVPRSRMRVLAMLPLRLGAFMAVAGQLYFPYQFGIGDKASSCEGNTVESDALPELLGRFMTQCGNIIQGWRDIEPSGADREYTPSWNVGWNVGRPLVQLQFEVTKPVQPQHIT
jgi:hypothetical protein